MKPKAQRIAIAEVCGWSPFTYDNGEPFNPPRWVSPNGKMTHTEQSLPNYIADLNAIHEAEQTLTQHFSGSVMVSYAHNLKLVAGRAGDMGWGAAHATAAQRAEAFLKTLNLWTDDACRAQESE